MDKLSSSVKNKKTTLKIKGALALWLLISSLPVPGEERLPVAFITDLLAALGEHLPLLLVGCAEILLAVYLIGKFLWGKVQHKPSGKGRGAEAIFLQEWKRQSEEVCILLRRRDRMPVYTAGNLREVLGVTLTRLREDAASLLAGLDDETERKQRWKTYLDWDGAKPLVAEAAMQNGRWVRFIAHRSRNDNYDLIFGRDITHEHQRLEDDKTKLMQVEEASQSKTTFLSRMSHEIRTPMNGIIGMLALAEGKMQKQDPAMQYLDKANELSAHLLSLINDILDMSRIEAGKVELENKPFSLRAMGDKLYDMFAKTLDARGIRYAVNFEGVTVDWLLGDELRLSQIMINFLSNAVKFTEQGEIVVTIRQMMLREGNVDLLLRVHDTGQGMDPNFVYRIFRPFEQESIETGKKYGGTGLGMAITDQLVKLMGGDIVVESQQSLIHRIPWGSRPRRAIISRASRAAAVRTIRMAAARLPRHQYRADPLRIPCRIRILERPAQVLLASRIRAASCIMKEMWMTAPYRRLLFSSRRIVRERQTRLRCTPGRKTSLPARFTMHWKPM